jgi:predicted metal-dependent phosphoesterase TrpH
MKRQTTIILLVASVCLTGFGQRKIVNLPDLPGYVTLKCDFHLHTVFSDGNIWPTVRVGEAYRDGLDAVAITDHVEYTPKKDYIPVDHNAAWKIAQVTAREYNIILVHGAEITRSMPPGHMNALFIQDASLLAVDSVMDAYAAAIRQGAFIHWNHPGWRSQEPDGIPKLYDIHKKLLANKWIHGIEFFNDSEHYPLVMTFCKQYNLAVIANSDNHGVISESYKDQTNRPMTLVFAKARTSDALKEAMFAGRTLAYFQDMLAGKEENAKPFFYQCISAGKPYSENDKSVYFEITNRSDIPFYLIDGRPGTPATIDLAANSITRVVLRKPVTFPLVYNVRNVITGENEVLKVELKY